MHASTHVSTWLAILPTLALFPIQARGVAEKAAAAKYDFFACASHEMRTPLFAVLSFVDVVLQMGDNLTSQQRDLLETAQASGKELSARLNSVLDVARQTAVDVASNLTPAIGLRAISIEPITESNQEARMLPLLPPEGAYVVKQHAAVPQKVCHSRWLCMVLCVCVCPVAR